MANSARVSRFDGGGLNKAVRTDAGFLKVPATVARSGVVLAYNVGGGRVRRELRLDDEVFAPESMASLALAPVTNGHPPTPRRLLDAVSAKQWAVGSVGDTIAREGSAIMANLIVTDSATIAAIESGKRQISAGYETDLDFTPGDFQGQAYDAIQRNIRYNHVAVVDSGRQPGARLHLDEADNQVMDAESAQEIPISTMKIKLNGVDFEVPDQAGQAFTADIAAKADALTKSQAKADSLEAELAKERKSRADAEDPAKLKAAVSARVALERTAGEILGASVKLDAMGDDEIRAAVVTKVNPSMADKLKDAAPAYIAASFDYAVGSHKPAAHPSLGAARAGEITPASAARVDSAEIRKQYAEAQKAAWQKPIPGAATRASN
jgi:hypothetical protein